MGTRKEQDRGTKGEERWSDGAVSCAARAATSGPGYIDRARRQGPGCSSPVQDRKMEAPSKGVRRGVLAMQLRHWGGWRVERLEGEGKVVRVHWMHGTNAALGRCPPLKTTKLMVHTGSSTRCRKAGAGWRPAHGTKRCQNGLGGPDGSWLIRLDKVPLPPPTSGVVLFKRCSGDVC